MFVEIITNFELLFVCMLNAVQLITCNLDYVIRLKKISICTYR